MTMTSERERAQAPPEVETLRTRHARGSGRIPRWVVKTASPVALVGLWQVLSSTGVLPRDVLAAPLTVAVTAADMWSDGAIQSAVLASTGRVVAGIAIGLVTAVVLATLSGLFRLGEDVIDAPVQMLRTVPVIGLIPLLIIWFGIGEEPKIALIALAVTFPLYMNLFGGIRNVDATLVEAARTLGLGWFGQVRHVILPSAMPQFLVGLRFSLGTAWLALVFGETINATSGIGYEMNTAREFFQTDVIVVCLALYALLGLLGDFVVRMLERGFLSWRPAFSGN
ncbi:MULTISPECIES: ABC transporter permease [Pseudonocardia]|uniref:ABC transporter permease n=2 Tax=Pseudonocardia TaxID=1847 RepID=A0ABQ0RU40_9PSEU|nr:MULTISPECIES: ABC transporter permease [Pseudonocardia]OSY37819.1 putative aliphatic sulfonates transport permease protein SsuC [Pseudonocardia autotrophica]TDN72518.1 sulfonate transport system permease protein [Pseudonocardia autotrophica]BBG03227.1 ABC transporter permease [Pseudonocardia autotrophica]GEC23844.1 ABC transporter permease [Pseudonocardia saturnea]